MIHSYRYRLYPTVDQQAVLTDILDMARWLYNHALAYRRKRWNESRKSVTYNEQAAMWRDWWHKVVHWLVKTYGGIALEDLDLTFMLRNGHLSRAAHDVALGLFYEILDYKAFEAGVEIAVVNPRNTSQMCSDCGVIVKKELHVRLHQCPDCGLTVDRDVNAAINILNRALG